MEFVSKLTSEEDILNMLRAEVASKVKKKRFEHILRVEEEITEMGKLFLPEQIFSLRVAAILHDYTKDLSFQEQLQLCEKFGIIRSEAKSAEVLHAITGAYAVKEMYPAIVTEDVFHAILSHTTGSDTMTVFDKLLFVADYIECGRTYRSCIELRQEFWSSVNDAPPSERIACLDKICLKILDFTIEFLRRENKPIDKDTFLARDAILCSQKQ